MKAEDRYKEELKRLGVYQSAFDPEIHQLCILERELSRARKEWAKTAPISGAPSFLSPLYQIITAQRQEIARRKDALGLTPRGLRRLQGQSLQETVSGTSALSESLDAFTAQIRAGITDA